MCRLSDAELNCVSPKIRRMSGGRHPLIGTSMRRYLPPIGTAGFERVAVSGYRRVPCPPPRMIAIVSYLILNAAASDAWRQREAAGRHATSFAAHAIMTHA